VKVKFYAKFGEPRFDLLFEYHADKQTDGAGRPSHVDRLHPVWVIPWQNYNGVTVASGF